MNGMMSDRLTVVVVPGAALLLLFLYSWIYVALKRKMANIENNEPYVYLTRLSGFLAFGIVPVGIIVYVLHSDISDFGIHWFSTLKSALWFSLLVLVVIPLNMIQARKKSNLKAYPQIRIKDWNAGVLFKSAVTWMLYLLAYEFFFRGFLLFASIQMFGVPWAVVINVVLYALAHLPKGRLETIGAIPLGILLCLITIDTGSFWVAFAIHVVMALSNEWLSLYFSKDINLSLSLRQKS